MHAAASYGHIHVLEYLVSKGVLLCSGSVLSFIARSIGGDVNVKDNDGETPLFTVESIQVARWLVENGAGLDCRNQEGNTVRPHTFHEMQTQVDTIHV